MLTDECVLCGRKISERRTLNDSYQALYCGICDFLMTDSSYCKNDCKVLNSQFYQVHNRIELYYTRKKELTLRYMSILNLLRKFTKASSTMKVLEIGSNIGFFADILARSDCDIKTVELNDKCREFQKIIYGIESYHSLDEIAADEQFDAIVMVDVLEHIPYPVNFVKSLKSHLRPSGVLFLQFPNKNSLAAKIAGNRWPWWSAPDHLYHFSEAAVRVLAEKCDFNAVHIDKHSPALDDLTSIPLVGKLFNVLLPINKIFPLNRQIHHEYGSLLQCILLNK